MDNTSHPESIVFFDSECLLCNASIQFIINHDKQAKLKFAPIYGINFQEKVIGRMNNSLPDSIVFLNDGKLYIESLALLKIGQTMGGIWNILARILYYVPLFIRDPIYRLIAKKRIVWFGKQKECLLMKGALQKRFLP